MFESFKPRKEELPVIEFESWTTEDEELRDLAIAVMSKMEWEIEEDEGEEKYASAFMPVEGYKDAFEELQKHLERKGHRYTDNAIAAVLAEISDVEDLGYAELFKKL